MPDPVQRVLVVPHELVADLYRVAAFHTERETIRRLLRVIGVYGRFLRRDRAEANENVKQVVACALVRSESRVLCVRRTKKTDRGALRLRHTVLFGGHVDKEDARSRTRLEDAVRRELEEELGLTDTAPQLLGAVTDPSNPVGRLHLGLVFDVQIAGKQVVISPELDNQEFVNARATARYELADWAGITKVQKTLDPWSGLVLGSTLGEAILQSGEPGSIQPLPLLWDEEFPTERLPLEPFPEAQGERREPA